MSRRKTKRLKRYWRVARLGHAARRVAEMNELFGLICSTLVYSWYSLLITISCSTQEIFYRSYVQIAVPKPALPTARVFELAAMLTDVAREPSPA